MKTTKTALPALTKRRNDGVWTASTPYGLAALAGLVVADELPPVADRKLIRELAGLTLDDIATALNVSQPTVYRWEVGQRKPTGPAEAVYALALRKLADIPMVRDALAITKAATADADSKGA